MNVRSSLLGVIAGGLAVACDSDAVGVGEYQGHTGVRSSTRESASHAPASGVVLSERANASGCRVASTALTAQRTAATKNTGSGSIGAVGCEE